MCIGHVSFFWADSSPALFSTAVPDTLSSGSEWGTVFCAGAPKTVSGRYDSRYGGFHDTPAAASTCRPQAVLPEPLPCICHGYDNRLEMGLLFFAHAAFGESLRNCRSQGMVSICATV